MPIDSEALRHIPLFAQLAQEELAHVAAMTVERHYDRGDMILLEGDTGGALHYVRSGLVKVYKTSSAGKDQMLRLIAAGNTFNDVPALDGGPNPASASALEPSTIYVIQRAELRKLILTRPEVAEAVVTEVAKLLMSAQPLRTHGMGKKAGIVDEKACYRSSRPRFPLSLGRYMQWRFPGWGLHGAYDGCELCPGVHHDSQGEHDHSGKRFRGNTYPCQRELG
jgi:CRP-like cAMP-binding protein